MVIRKLMGLLFLMIFFSCSEAKVIPDSNVAALLERSKALQLRGEKVTKSLTEKRDSIEALSTPKISWNSSKEEGFVNIQNLSDDFVLDMRYATSDNFLKEKVYSCAKCYVRKEVAKSLIAANKEFMKLGYKIKLFDCYRPYSVQKKMWKIFPNPGYVADPKGGSIHNKGAAVDITLVKLDGSKVDMGTKFDHFGKEAHHAYAALPKEVIQHRKLLRKTMEKNGFQTIRTEWWHYNFQAGRTFKISDFRWECE